MTVCFAQDRLTVIGIVRSYPWESPKPQEFRSAGQNWENIGWKVRVHFIPLANQIRPKAHMDALGPEVLAGLIGSEVTQFMRPAEVIDADQSMRQSGDDLDTWEHYIETQIETDTAVRDTEKTALIRARRGQGLFKERVAAIESRCRITGVDNPIHLVASHCKPWARFKQRGATGRRKRAAADAEHRSPV